MGGGGRGGGCGGGGWWGRWWWWRWWLVACSSLGPSLELLARPLCFFSPFSRPPWPRPRRVTTSSKLKKYRRPWHLRSDISKFDWRPRRECSSACSSRVAGRGAREEAELIREMGGHLCLQWTGSWALGLAHHARPLAGRRISGNSSCWSSPTRQPPGSNWEDCCERAGGREGLPFAERHATEAEERQRQSGRGGKSMAKARCDLRERSVRGGDRPVRT